MHRLLLRRVEANLKIEILVALWDSEHIVRMLPILEASLLLRVPTAHSALSNRNDRDKFALESLGMCWICGQFISQILDLDLIHAHLRLKKADHES